MRKRSKRWLRTDEYLDTVGSLSKAATLAAAAHQDSTEWKWLLIAVHSATQGMLVLSLSMGNGLLTLKGPHAAAWLKAYRSGGPWPQKMDLDYFLELYKKAKIRLPANSLSADHDDAVRRLNDLRNGFIHFGAQGWSIELAGLPSICRHCLEVTKALGWSSGLVFWRSQAQGARARRSLNAAVRQLKSLERVLKS